MEEIEKFLKRFLNHWYIYESVWVDEYTLFIIFMLKWLEIFFCNNNFRVLNHRMKIWINVSLHSHQKECMDRLDFPTLFLSILLSNVAAMNKYDSIVWWKLCRYWDISLRVFVLSFVGSWIIYMYCVSPTTWLSQPPRTSSVTVSFWRKTRTSW